MEQDSLLVYGREKTPPPLRALLEALNDAGYPLGIGVGIAGDATEEELDSQEWETALFRWKEPELHEVWMLTRYVPGTDEEAGAALIEAATEVRKSSDEAGRLIVLDLLANAKAVYQCDIEAPMVEDPDHPAWDALDVALRNLADLSDGLVYAPVDGFFDSEGELILAATDAADSGQ